jgi:hypothetical protein
VLAGIRVGWSGHRIPVGAKFSASVETVLQWVPSLFPGGKAAGVWR